MPETEDENEEKTSEEAVVNMDNSDDVEKRGNDLTSATEVSTLYSMHAVSLVDKLEILMKCFMFVLIAF